jgi:hypothetical protein
MSYGIHYASSCALDLIGFTYSDWVGDGKDHKSTYGYTLNLGSNPFFGQVRSNHPLLYLP